MSTYHPIVSIKPATLAACHSCFATDLNPQTFPFRMELSLAPLVEFWRQATASSQPTRAALRAVLEDALLQAPELLEPITDLAVFERHHATIELLMSAVIPASAWEQAYMAALLPYQFQSFYATPQFQRLLAVCGDALTEHLNVDAQTVTWFKLVRAYSRILRDLYGIEAEFEYPLIFTVNDPDTALPRHFQVYFDIRFVQAKALGEPPQLTPEMRQEVLANLADPQVLMHLLPPEHFMLQGFTVFQAVDVTDQVVLSSLKRELIEQASIVSNNSFRSLQHHLRTLFRNPHLQFTLTALQGDEVMVLKDERFIEHGCIFADSAHHHVSEFAGSVYERAVTQGELLIIDDLSTYPHHSAMEEALLRHGIRNIAVSPLYYQGTLIGTLDLKSTRPGDLHAINAVKLREVLPLFSVAIKRSMDELNANLQAIIKEECTAIHPTVEWRFRQAALRYMIRKQAGAPGEMEPIVFPEVYPLYAVSDIRSSSMHRNAAIQADVTEHLRLAQEILRVAHGTRALPRLDNLVYRIEKCLKRLERGLGSGDEVTIIDFLRREVEPLFPHLATFAPAIQEHLSHYQTSISATHGTLYRRRKAYEESVTLINETISAYLDSEEEKAQAMFPHYFEKHKSDGVEFGMYIGASLMENGQFNAFYLHNIRLWQLMVLCGIVRRMECIKACLPVPLETAHLILVQHTPLSIRFRFDEKRFDVDGAYNVRYEIVKKRIDKAHIRGTNERLTQPGKIAIVYSHPREAQEYREYIEYLQTLGYFAQDVEDHPLEDLQGVQGLRALRVTVVQEETLDAPCIGIADLEAAVQKIAQERQASLVNIAGK